MPKFEDSNGVLWDIRTTSVRVGTQTATDQFVAAIDDDSPRDYSANTIARGPDAETFLGTEDFPVSLSWPVTGNPLLKGAGDERLAVAAIRKFAAAEGRKPEPRTIVVRVGASADPSKPKEGLPFLAWVAIVYLGYRVIKKATGGKRYAG
jgi:hypothetical protein